MRAARSVLGPGFSVAIGALAALVQLGAAANSAALIDAVRSGSIEDVRALLEQRVDVNSALPDGTTALHWAAHSSQDEVAELLLAAGANANAANRYGVTPLTLAATSGSLLFNFSTNGNYELLHERLAQVTRDPAQLGVLLAIVYTVASVAQLVMGRLIDRFSLKRLYLSVLLLQIPFLALAAHAESWMLYQAPELREPAGALGPLSDIFSLGALAYFVVTGRPPGESVAAVSRRLSEDKHLDPSLVDDTVPDKVAELIRDATALSPINRYDDAGEWADGGGPPGPAPRRDRRALHVARSRSALPRVVG